MTLYGIDITKEFLKTKSAYWLRVRIGGLMGLQDSRVNWILKKAKKDAEEDEDPHIVLPPGLG